MSTYNSFFLHCLENNLTSVCSGFNAGKRVSNSGEDFRFSYMNGLCEAIPNLHTGSSRLIRFDFVAGWASNIVHLGGNQSSLLHSGVFSLDDDRSCPHVLLCCQSLATPRWYVVFWLCFVVNTNPLCP